MMAKNLALEFANASCPVAAFDLARTFTGTVLPDPLAAALGRFHLLPCAETAALLAHENPEIAAVIASTSEAALRLTSPDNRGPAYVGIDEYISEANSRLAKARTIQGFLHELAKDDVVRIGFHRARDQRELLARLRVIGLTKPFLRDARQWLRNTLAANPSAWLVAIDLICIHGVTRGSERFWNALGGEDNTQSYLQSEVLYNLGDAASKFEAEFASQRST